MDYEKKYNEALERAEQIAVQGGASRYLVTQIFPELKESEDERIRKEMITYFTEIKSTIPIGSPNHFDSYLAYLEKQKEQKPNVEICPHSIKSKSYRENGVPTVSDELIDIIKGEFEGFRTLLKKKGIDYEPQRGYWEGFARLFDSSAREYVKEQKPAWSEEDEKMLNGIIGRGCSQIPYTEPGLRGEQIDWLKNKLKSLRPCPSWKPTQEQMEALEIIVRYGDKESTHIKSIRDLYDDLKKL